MNMLLSKRFLNKEQGSRHLCKDLKNIEDEDDAVNSERTEEIMSSCSCSSNSMSNIDNQQQKGQLREQEPASMNCTGSSRRVRFALSMNQVFKNTELCDEGEIPLWYSRDEYWQFQLDAEDQAQEFITDSINNRESIAACLIRAYGGIRAARSAKDVEEVFRGAEARRHATFNLEALGLEQVIIQESCLVYPRQRARRVVRRLRAMRASPLASTNETQATLKSQLLNASRKDRLFAFYIAKVSGDADESCFETSE